MTTLWELISRFATLFVWWTIIAPWEAGIRVRLGNRTKTLTPGIHFRIPYLDAVFKQTTRMRITLVQLQTISTRDGKTVTICATVGYCISDIEKLYNTLHHADETIRNLIAGYIAQIVQEKTISNCTPADIESEVSRRIDLSQYGLDQTVVRIIDFAIVKTYRILQDQRWQTTDNLDTATQSRTVGP